MAKNLIIYYSRKGEDYWNGGLCRLGVDCIDPKSGLATLGHEQVHRI